MWTLSDRKYFLDTIFKNYPAPSIFIHREIDNDGRPTYHVVDGKQRLETILMFKNNKIRLDKEFGDETLNGKTFDELPLAKKRDFWSYIINVDYVESADTTSINEVFDRLNRNSRNLNEQELRHAKYSGWFINEVTKEVEEAFWEKMRISTKVKSKRMKDAQLVSELLMVLLEGKIVGFDQHHITDIYAQYDTLPDIDGELDLDAYLKDKARVKKYIEAMADRVETIPKTASTANNFYTLWSLVALCEEDLPRPEELAEKYSSFMDKVNYMTDETDPDNLPISDKMAHKYYLNSRGANTDLKQRTGRLESLKNGLLENENH